jgi:hypothetical protein
VFVKRELRDRARRLRSEDGLALGVIAKQLRVSKSSVSRWTRDIELRPEQHAALRAGNPIYNQQLRGQGGRRASARAARIAAQEHGRELARRNDALHRAGCMLYWAEGAKNRNVVAFTNSDVAMMRLFVRFLAACYGVAAERMSLFVNCHVTNGLTEREIVHWWLRELSLPSSCARKSTVNHVSTASRRRRGNVLPYGTARVVVHSTFIVQSIFGAIQAYAGFARSEWLD